MLSLRRMRWPVLLVAALLALPAGAVAEERSALAAYNQFADGFLDWYYAEHPVRATSLGIHRYDGRLSSFTPAAIERRTAALHGWLRELKQIDREDLEGPAYYDYILLDHAIRAELLDLEQVRSWQRNPMDYSNYVAWSLASLVDRQFGTLDARVESLTSRLEQVPLVLASARENLKDVPPLWADLAVRGTRGVVSFLENDVPRALVAQGIEQVASERRDGLDGAMEAAVGALKAHVEWLEGPLAERVDGDFRLGKALFERKVALEEHVNFTAEELRRINEAAIVEYKEWVRKSAAEIDADADPAEVMDSVTGNIPTSEELLPTAREYVEDARQFIIDNGILTLPSDRTPVVRPTPEYARMGFASMSTPGAFETEATEAYYNITNVDPEWDEEQKRQHLTYFNFPALLGVTVHEAFPGHFVQLLYEQQIPTEVRKVFTPASLVEGWAHYTEQMMVDEGLGDGDPEVRMAQLRRALQRHARWYAGLSMHAFGNTVEDAAERYQDIAYFAEFPALREVQRGTYNPTYLYYAMGRMQILKLREDYRRMVEARGETFSLREFHDRFLKLGLPVSLAREVMLGPDAGPSLELPGEGGPATEQ